MSPAIFRGAFGLLMLIPFGIVLATAAIFLIHIRRRNRAQAMAGSAPVGEDPHAAFRSALTDQPARWLAIKAANPAVALAALNLHHPTPCSMEEGLAEAKEDKLFISPSLHGWVLVVGSGLPDPAEDVDAFFRFLSDLSRKLGHVQFFSSSRVLNYHAWALLEKGRVLRAYAWAGETLWNQGIITAAERELDLACFDYGADVNSYAARDVLAANCEKVIRLATRWGIDPASLAASNSLGTGIVGELSQSSLR